jgi:hypothetical protein
LEKAGAQGIEAVSFFAGGKKDTSGKPGRRGAAMRPNFYKTGEVLKSARAAMQFTA